MAYKYRIVSCYDDEWYGRVPFYWRSVRFWQSVLSYGEAIPWTIGSICLYTAGFVGFGSVVQYSLWFIVPLVILSVLFVTQVVSTVIIANSRRMDGERHDALNLHNYYKLPKKIRRQLRPAAKQINKINDTWYARDKFSNWSDLVDGYVMLHPYTEPMPKINNVLAQETEKLNKLIEVSEAELAKIEAQRKIEHEMQIEVREKTKKYCEENGLEYIELNV